MRVDAKLILWISLVLASCYHPSVSADQGGSDVFKLVNSDGAEIKGEEMGLLLHRGGTVCNGFRHGSFDYITADAICKEMNFTRAKRWTTDKHFDIQMNYKMSLGNVNCKSAKWSSWSNWAQCSYSEKIEWCTWHSDDVFLSCTDENLLKSFTLVDSEGNEITEGEQLGLLLYRGGTVCNHGWKTGFSYKAADAICRQLNFTRAERWTTKESFDIQSNYGIHLSNIECNSLVWKSCTYTEKTNNCGHGEDIFLSCTDKDVKLFSLVDSKGKEVAAGELGLLLYRGGTVRNYHSYHDFNDFGKADVICKKMNFTYGTKWTKSVSFEIQSNYDVRLEYINGYYGGWKTSENVHHYDHQFDVFLSCTDSQQLFRLVDAEGDDINGEELGLLLYRGGTVCDLSWGSHAFEFETADVICRKMNFTRAISWTTGENFDIQSNYEIHATLNCHDTRCSYNIDVRNCEHSQDVFLSCTDTVEKLQLFTLVDSEGNTITEEEQLGLLLYRGGTVCSNYDSYVLRAADAICKEMNFTHAERWTTKESFDIQSKYNISLNSVTCTDSLDWKRNCSSSSKKSTYCDHSKDVFISCADAKKTQLFTLVDSEGNDITGPDQLGLLLYRGGTVCYHGDYINYYLADVVCRQMNFTRAERWTTKESYDIQSNYETYVLVHDSVECITGEWENCTYSEYTYNCDHSQDLFLSCTGTIKIKRFTFVDLEGKNIVEELQLGLPLYRGAVFCGDSYFNFKVADAICREMNFTRAARWIRKSSSDIQGIEDKILGKVNMYSCFESGNLDWKRCKNLRNHDCGDSKYVFLSCTDTVEKLTLFTMVDSEGNDVTEEEQLGLILYRGGTVCERNAESYNHQFSFFAADAICRQLNFTRAERWTTKESYDIQSNYDINLGNARCFGNLEWEKCHYSENNLGCGHNTDVFLSCSDTKQLVFTLVDPEGNYITGPDQIGLLLYRGGTVCYEWATSFKSDSADVICRQMNFARAAKWTIEESFDIQNNYPIHVRDISCISDGEWPDSCSSYEDTGRCEHSQDVFLSCTNTVESLFTLVDSEGNEITEEEQLGLLLYRGGTVCQDRRGYTPYFTLDVADTICREMNFKQASRWTLRNSFDIQSNYSIHIKDVQCSTEEWESCYFYEDTSSCEHSQDVFLSCAATDKNIFTLVDSAGEEITEEKQLGLLLYRGGTVCVYYDHFTFKSADAICREMNFTRAERWTTKESFDVQSNYEITVENVYCVRAEWESCGFTETYVTESYGWCKHSKDLFLSCTDDEDLKLFTFVDTEGNEITEEKQLGLLLFRGGTLCGFIDFMAADAACRYMNFTRAERWTNKESFDIQSNYHTNMGDIDCSSQYTDGWNSCSYLTTPHCGHDEDVFLSCSDSKEVKLFTMVDSEGNEITEEKQLGLLLYRGGAMRGNTFYSKEADAVCKLMNFTRAERSVYLERFGIQNDYDTNRGFIECFGTVWESCRYYEESIKFWHNYVFLSCSDTIDTKQFTLVDSEGNDITGKEQLGLVLYGGRTVYIENEFFNFKAADAICREMNYTHATYWTTSYYELFGIRYQYISSLFILYCDKAEWKSCRYSEHPSHNYNNLHVNCTTDTDTKLFTLVDSEGNEITEGEQLGLLLYRGGAVCSHRESFSYTAADAICKEMNFARAERWTSKISEDIYSNYRANLGYVWCKSTDWDSCSYPDSASCGQRKYVFLECTNNYIHKPFTLVNSEGNEITEGEQLGLLLYRGGTVCNHGWNKGSGSKAADAICKEMNFKGADRWTTKESFDIQYGRNISLGYLECNSEEWGNCTYSEDTQNCYHSQDLFLSCTIVGRTILNPSSATVNIGTSHVFDCVFPNPFGSDFHEIIWTFKGPADSAPKPMIGNEDVYDDENRRIIDGTTKSDARGVPNQISASLTIGSVNSEARGDYMCIIKWDTIFIKSSAATLIVRSIITPPQVTNAAVGAGAKFFCFAIGDVVAIITFHKANNNEEVGSVDIMNQTNGDGSVTTRGFITLSNVNDTDNSSEYYCKAVWSSLNVVVKSASVALFVLNLKGSTSSVGGVRGTVAEFQCRADVRLKANSGGDPYLVRGKKVNADTSVSWKYFDSSDSSWKSIDNVNRFSVKRSTTSRGGERVFPISVRQLQDNDNNLKLKCSITYKTDETINFYGSTITSGELTLKIASITSFTVSNPNPIVGETITLTCVASGETVPIFNFRTGRRRNVDPTFFSPVNEGTPSTVGTTHTVLYSFKTVNVNSMRGGQVIDCLVGFKFICELRKSTENKSKSPRNHVLQLFCCQDNGAIVTTTDLGDGSLKQSITCPVDSSTARFSLKERPGRSASDIICTKETGRYSPPFLAGCKETKPISTGYGIQRMNFPNTAEQPAPCTPEATGQWSRNIMLRKLNSLDDNVCGFRHKVRCLIDNTCTLNTAKSDCNYKNGKIEYEFHVDLIQPVWTFIEKDQLIKLTGRIKFWSCANSYVDDRRKREAEQIDLEKTPRKSRV